MQIRQEGVTKEQQHRANQISRAAGYGPATLILFGVSEVFISHTRYGYRKITTGEYVPTAYRANFGWKNTYYQEAENVVQLVR